MSLDNLKSDLKSNLESLNQMGNLTSSAELVLHLKNTLWPFLETVVGEIEEVDEVMQDIVDGAEDIIHPETAKVFMTVIVTGLAIAKALEEKSPGDAAIKKAIEQYRVFCKTAQETLETITFQAPEGEDDDDEEGDEGDDDEDDGGDSADDGDDGDDDGHK